MLDFFGYEDLGKRTLGAIEAALVDGTCLAPDLGGTASTSQVGDKIVSIL